MSQSALEISNLLNKTWILCRAGLESLDLEAHPKICVLMGIHKYINAKYYNLSHTRETGLHEHGLFFLWVLVNYILVSVYPRPNSYSNGETTPTTRWWFQIFFYVHPYLGKMNPFWRAYFSKGLKPPTRQSLISQLITTETLLPRGEDGTITADLTVGTPPQQITVQLDTGSQKYLGTKIGKFCQKDV